MSIASKIAILKQETLKDTLSLITHDDLQKAVQMLRNARVIHIFAASNNCLIAEEFCHNLHRIKKDARVHALQGELIFDAILANPRDVAIIVSYSGETELLNRVAQTLKGNNTPCWPSPTSGHLR